MASQVWVNEHDLEVDLGITTLGYRELDAWSAGIAYERDVVSIPGQLAGFAAPDAMMPPRVIRLTVQLSSATAAVRDIDLSTLLDVFAGLCEIRFGDSPTKVIEGFVTREASAALIRELSIATSPHLVTLDIVCPNPSKRERYSRSVAFGATRTPVPLGTLYSAGDVYIMGSASNPVLTYRDSGGNTIGTPMTFTVTLGATEYLKTSLLNKTIKKYTAGVESDAITAWTAGDWFVTDPEHGSFSLSSWPMLSVSAGTALYIYEKRYRS